MKALRKTGILLAVILLGVGGYVYSQRSHTDKTEPRTTYQTFVVAQTTTIKQPAGTLVLRFTPLKKVVIAVKANTDKGYFSLECAGRSKTTNVPDNGVWKSVSCRLAAVHYSDSSADTGLVILRPKS
ncbi:MAG TPA: hypothetical protein VJ843_04500 [Candidatus Saccharimonadales bacterium]|nr:hypothetical protein [Candidatus Saccharimonadales bacterium]